MIIFGVRGRLATLGTGTFYCPRCRADRAFTRKGVRRWFTLFFLPIFPLGATTSPHVRCDTCDAAFAEDVLSLPTADERRRRYEQALSQCAVSVLKAGDPSSTVTRAACRSVLAELLGPDLDPGEDGLDAALATLDPAQLSVYASPVSHELDPRQAERFFGGCVQVALADGPPSPEERDALRNLGESLNLTAAHQLGIVETLRAPSERSPDGGAAP